LVKIAPAQIDGFLAKPDPAIRAVLIFGQDSGMVRERVEILAKTLVDDLQDPFRVADLSAGDLKDDPARLSDEAAAISMMGGRRVVRVRDSSDSLSPIAKDFFAGLPGDALMIFEAGDLPARSSLRKLFESAREGAAIACYRDDQRSLPAVIQAGIREQGHGVSANALAFLAANLGGDRQVTRREIEKLCLYKGLESGTIEIEDAIACIGDTAELTLDDLSFSVAAGQLPMVERTLNRSFQEGSHAVTILRAVARHFQKLQYLSGLMAQGVSLEDAAKRLRPPLFWKTAAQFKSQANAWPQDKLARVTARLLLTEQACKQTGAPSQLLCSRTLFEISAASPLRRRTGR
jgi:DNA polymerase-3 subunit delta